MGEYIKYIPVEQQVEKLKLQGLIIPDENEAISHLKIYGYSNLIKSYRDPYIVVNKDGEKLYRSGVTIYQILSLYSFDKNLRNSVMASMLDLEEHIKEVVADVVAQSFGTHQDDYLQFKNYKDRRKKERFTLAYILSSFRDALLSDKNPVKHYREKYGTVPPWILFKNVYFSTIINFLDLFKPAQQQSVADRLYDNSVLGLKDNSLRKLMMDTLYLCLEYRNLVAHGGRTYNYQQHYSNIRVNEIFPTPTAINPNGFNGLLTLLSLFRYKNPYNNLNHSLEYSANQHFANFPQDVTYLGQILNIDFIPKQYVYVTRSSNKYHLVPHCSGISDPVTVELEEAKCRGFTPCKRCVKSL